MGGVLLPGIPHWPDEPVFEAVAFVTPTAELDFSRVAELLRHAAPDASHGRYVGEGRQVIAAWAAGWMVRVSLACGILASARAMAEDCYAAHPRAADIAVSDRWVEVQVADPAGTVAAFECQDAVREWLGSLSGVALIAPPKHG